MNIQNMYYCQVTYGKQSAYCWESALKLRFQCNIVNIGACGAFTAVAPKTTGRGPGIVITQSLVIGF